METELIGLVTSTFLFGLTSSVHCVTMCGPLVCVIQAGNPNKVTSILYQIGRLTSYALLGGILGMIGKGANALGEMKEIQGLSAFLSLFLLGIVGIRLVFWNSKLAFFPSFQKYLTPLFNFFRERNQIWALGLFLGLLSSFLPCGILYPAYAVAFASGNLDSGTLVMVSFFLGTFPALFGFSMGIGWLQRNIQPKYTQYVGVALILVSLVFLVLRLTHTVHSENCEHPETSLYLPF